MDLEWVGEPCPGTLVEVIPLPLEEVDEYSDPPQGTSVVLVHRDGVANVAEVGSVPSQLPGPLLARSFSPSGGLPVACDQDGLWLGMPLRSDQGAGGPWHTTDRGHSWFAESDGIGVNSILVDPDIPGRVLVTESSGLLRSSVHELKYPTTLIERPSLQAGWRPFEGPPHSANSDIELCGFLPDRTLVVRVDEFLYSSARRSILSRLVVN